MLTHIVLWKYREDVGTEVRAEHIKRLRELKGKIDVVEDLSAGSDVLRLPRSFDTGIVVTFRDRAALDAYNVHPDHVRIVEFGKPLSAQVVSVDFES